WFYIAAALSFYIAVGSPLDAVGENYLFSAHMVQHNILMYVTAVLVIFAIPGWLIDGTLGRYAVGRQFLRIFFHPVFAGFCFTVVFSCWHFPALYDAALHNKWLH